MARLFVLALGVAAFAVGCAAEGSQRDLAFELRKAETQREQATLALEEEQAKVYVLDEELRTLRRENADLKRDLNHARRDLQATQAERDELYALIQRRATKPLERPDLAPSPLPDALDSALASFAERHPEWVTYVRPAGLVRFSNDRLFRSGEAEVRGAGRLLLKEFGPLLADLSAERFEVVVIGHTDDLPITGPAVRAAHPSNWHLSVDRAIGVKDVLVEFGLAEQAVAVKGYGSLRPLGGERALNRRVEVVIVPQEDADRAASESTG